MAGGINMTYEIMDQVSSELTAIVSEIVTNKSTMMAKVNYLCESWESAASERHREEFETVGKNIDNLTSMADELVNSIKKYRADMEELDTDSVKDRSGVRSSLTDMSNIPVFTDEFEEKKEAADQRKQSEEQELNTKVFSQEILQYVDSDITAYLFRETTEELVIRNEQEALDKDTLPAAAVFMIMAIVLIFGAIYWSGRKGKRKNDVNDQPEASTGR